MFRIEMLPAAHGDCIWITYGAAEDPKRILIDGGTRFTYKYLRAKILELPADQRHFELLIVTHIDGDHIEGVIRLLQDFSLGATFGEIWFNGQPQLDQLPDPAPTILGPEQGEYLSALIQTLEENQGVPLWNTSFQRKAVMVAAGEPLPFHEFAGMKLTVVSPGLDQLFKLKDEWDSVMADAKFDTGDVASALEALAERKDLAAPTVLGGSDEGEEETEEEPEPEANAGVEIPTVLGESDGDFGGDTSEANGSSIAVIVEFDDARVLLSGDAFAPVLESGLKQFMAERGLPHVDLDMFKIPHHGSVGNVSAELLALMKCRRYMISTNGAVFHHPHDRSIDLILSEHRHRAKPQLIFNYHSTRNHKWSDRALMKSARYEAIYPMGIDLDL